MIAKHNPNGMYSTKTGLDLVPLQQPGTVVGANEEKQVINPARAYYFFIECLFLFDFYRRGQWFFMTIMTGIAGYGLLFFVFEVFLIYSLGHAHHVTGN